MKRLLSCMLALFMVMTMIVPASLSEEVAAVPAEEAVVQAEEPSGEPEEELTELIEVEEAEISEEDETEAEAQPTVTVTAETAEDGTTVLTAEYSGGEVIAWYWQRLDAAAAEGKSEEEVEALWETREADGNVLTAEAAPAAYAYRAIAEANDTLVVSEPVTVEAVEGAEAEVKATVPDRIEIDYEPYINLSSYKNNLSEDGDAYSFEAEWDTEEDGDLVWTSSNTSVLTLTFDEGETSYCFPTPKKVGTAMVKVSSKEDPSIIEYFAVTVVDIKNIVVKTVRLSEDDEATTYKLLADPAQYTAAIPYVYESDEWWSENYEECDEGEAPYDVDFDWDEMSLTVTPYRACSDILHIYFYSTWFCDDFTVDVPITIEAEEPDTSDWEVWIDGPEVVDLTAYKASSSRAWNDLFGLKATTSDGMFGELVWGSSDPKIAKVTKTDEVGLTASITPVSEGTAMIYVYSKDHDDIAGVCTVKVIKVNSISLYPNKLTISDAPEDEEMLTIRVNPSKYQEDFEEMYSNLEDNSGYYSFYATSAKDIVYVDMEDATEAYVSSYGDSGKDTITAGLIDDCTDKWIYKATAAITVTGSETLTGVHFADMTSDTVEMELGDEDIIIEAVTEPSMAEADYYTQKSSNPKVADIVTDDNDDLVGGTRIRANGVGTATITVTAVQGKVKKNASFKVTVTDPSKSTGVTVYCSDVGYTGDTEGIYAEVMPWSAEDDCTCTWKVSNPAVAEIVDGNSFITDVTYLKAGTVTFTATVTDATGKIKKTASKKVTVIDPDVLKTLTLSEKTLSTYVGADEDGEAPSICAMIYPDTLYDEDWDADPDLVEVSVVSSKPGVVEVVDPTSLTTELEPVSAGTANITVTVTQVSNPKNKKTATCKVTVYDHSESYMISKEELSLTVGASATLKATLYPKTSAPISNWFSDDESVVSVVNGKVTAVGAGKASVGFETMSGEWTYCTVVTVTTPAVGVGIYPSKVEIDQNETYPLKATVYPAAADQTLTWKSSNPKIATVSDYGVITGISAGTVTVTATTSNKKSVTCKVTVTGESQESDGITYRALLIGEVSFNPVCNRNWGDVKMMGEMLSSVNDGRYQITKKKDLTYAGVKDAISSTFAGADEDDVSLFFYASHGVTSSGSSYGALATYNGELIQTYEIADWLKQVPGKVIVIIGTCGSGAVIENNNNSANSYDPDTMSAAIIEAFREADPGITVVTEEGAKSGEMRDSKFIVMTAAMGGESSWGTEYYEYNYFPKWLTESVATKDGYMAADTDENGELTVDECYSYVADEAADAWFTDSDDNEYQQHPQVYPENCSYVLFTK